jgi:hypothetical protein
LDHGGIKAQEFGRGLSLKKRSWKTNEILKIRHSLADLEVKVSQLLFTAMVQ